MSFTLAGTPPTRGYARYRAVRWFLGALAGQTSQLLLPGLVAGGAVWWLALSWSLMMLAAGVAVAWACWRRARHGSAISLNPWRSVSVFEQHTVCDLIDALPEGETKRDVRRYVDHPRLRSRVLLEGEYAALLALSCDQDGKARVGRGVSVISPDEAWGMRCP